MRSHAQHENTHLVVYVEAIDGTDSRTEAIPNLVRKSRFDPRIGILEPFDGCALLPVNDAALRVTDISNVHENS
jgi:hypothetical protein